MSPSKPITRELFLASCNEKSIGISRFSAGFIRSAKSVQQYLGKGGAVGNPSGDQLAELVARRSVQLDVGDVDLGRVLHGLRDVAVVRRRGLQQRLQMLFSRISRV